MKRVYNFSAGPAMLPAEVIRRAAEELKDWHGSGIVVMNTPGGNTITTAEHTIALMVSMARMIPQATASMKQGKWEKKKFMGVELYNKTLGIVGVGNIGSHVAKVAQGFGMNVLAYDPYLSEEKKKSLGVTVVDLDTLFAESD